MKKKLISVLLSAALVCSVLAGCGKSDSNSGSSAAADESGAADAGSDGAAAQDTAPAEAVKRDLCVCLVRAPHVQ